MKMGDLLKNKALIWSIVGVVILAIGIIVALQLIPQPQDTRQKAASETGTTEVKISPTTMSLNFNEQKTATVQVNTKTLGVRGISAVLSYPFTGATPNIAASDLTLASQFSQAPWTCNVKKIDTDTQSHQVIIQVGCTVDTQAMPTGFKTNSQTVDFFTFKLKAGTTATTTPLTITFNNQETSMGRIDQGEVQEVAAIPTTNLKVTVVAGTNSPPPSGSGSPSPSPSATASATPTPTPSASKTLDLSLSGLGCGLSTFTADVTAHDPDSSSVSGIGIVFEYNGQIKNGTTNSSGAASATFDRASSNKEIKVSAGAFQDSTRTVELPSGCSTSDTSGGTISCNGSCTASRDCTSGLSCVSGYCRDSRCSTDSSCGCADVNVASQNGTTQLPQTGFDQTLAMSVLGFLFLLGGAQLWWSHQKAHSTTTEEEQD